MSLKKLLCAALTTAVAAPALLVGTASPGAAACPADTVGKLQTVFDPSGWFGSEEDVAWYMRDQNLRQDVGRSSDLVVELALWPMEKGRQRFTVEAPMGPDFMEVALFDGKVSLYASVGTGGDEVADVLTYQPGSWNNLKLRFDLDQSMAHVTLNGQTYSMPSAAGTQIDQMWFHNRYDTDVQDTGTAYLDNLTVTKVDGGTSTVLYSEDFEDDQAGGAPPSLTFVDSTPTFAKGSACKLDSTIDVDVRQTSEKVTVLGSVAPAAPGWPVRVQLLKKAGGTFVPAARTRKLTLDHASSFRTSFQQPAGARKCRTTVTFAGTPSIAKDEVTRTFAC